MKPSGKQYIDVVYVDEDGVEVHATEAAPLIATAEEWLDWWEVTVEEPADESQ